MQDDSDRFQRFPRLLGDDIPQQPFMRGLGGEQTTGIRINVFESFLQMHGGRTIEFVQYFVMRSLGQSHVEIDIGRDTVVQSSGCGGRTAPGEVCPDLDRKSVV